MKCQRAKCSGILRTTHTYSTESQKTQRLVCRICGMVYTAMTVVRAASGRGTGARAEHARLQSDGSPTSERS